LFALDLTDSELRDWLTTEPELPEDRLTVIARDPEGVLHALQGAPTPAR
jgi:hypothetical protein